MAAEVRCSCGKRLLAAPQLFGKRVACPACGRPLLIPHPERRAAPAATGEGAAEIRVQCRCGRAFRAAAHLAGQRVACPACGAPLAIGAAASRLAAQPAPQPVVSAEQTSAWFDDSAAASYGGLPAGGAFGRPSAPSLRLSQRLDQLSRSPPGGLAVWICGLVAVLLAIGAVAAFNETALIVHIAICIVLAACCAIGGEVWIAAVIIEHYGWGRGLLALLGGFGQLFLAQKHWAECKRPMCLALLGFSLFFVWLFVPLAVFAITHPSS